MGAWGCNVAGCSPRRSPPMTASISRAAPAGPIHMPELRYAKAAPVGGLG